MTLLEFIIKNFIMYALFQELNATSSSFYDDKFEKSRLMRSLNKVKPFMTTYFDHRLTLTSYERSLSGLIELFIFYSYLRLAVNVVFFFPMKYYKYFIVFI